MIYKSSLICDQSTVDDIIIVKFEKVGALELARLGFVNSLLPQFRNRRPYFLTTVLDEHLVFIQRLHREQSQSGNFTATETQNALLGREYSAVFMTQFVDWRQFSVGGALVALIVSFGVCDSNLSVLLGDDKI